MTKTIELLIRKNTLKDVEILILSKSESAVRDWLHEQYKLIDEELAELEAAEEHRNE